MLSFKSQTFYHLRLNNNAFLCSVQTGFVSITDQNCHQPYALHKIIKFTRQTHATLGIYQEKEKCKVLEHQIQADFIFGN